MWFLTVDPLIWVSMFIAKLSKRQYCWRILEEFHCQEFFQFFDVNCGLFMCLHFSIGCYDSHRTSWCRHGFQFIGIQILFCWSCASMHRSQQQILFPLVSGWWRRQAPIFQKVRRMLFYVSPLVSGYILPFSTLLYGHIALAFPSLLETDPPIFGHWVCADEDHLANYAKRSFLVSNVSMT